MTTETAVATSDDRDHKRSMALLKAVGLDRVPPEQREIALAIAKRYELDLLLKHLVLVDGRPYITRDGLLHVAHRSGQLDGIEVTDPELVDMPGVGQFWRAKASVYRKDMTRPFTYLGRYPAKGGNQRYAPEMAVKVAEVMSLRRAFDVSAPVIEERWDLDQPTPEPQPDLRETIAARREAITSGPAVTTQAGSEGGEDSVVPLADEPPHPAMTGGDTAGAEVVTPMPVTSPCTGFHATKGKCVREEGEGHEGRHRNKDGESWTDKEALGDA